MSEHNAAGARVRTRPAWVLVLLMFLLGPPYRIFWSWRTGADIHAFAGRRSGWPATEARPLTVHAWLVPLLLAMSFIGWLFTVFAIAPWSASFAPAAIGGVGLTSVERSVYLIVGAVFLAPAVYGLGRLRGQVRWARVLAGLPADTRWTRGVVFWPLVLAEVAAVPLWLFTLQHSLNDLWCHYPPLLEEDLHGELAPPATRAAEVARRPELHVERLEAVAQELEHPRKVPWVTIFFAAVCIAAFAWQVSMHGFFPDEHDLEDVGGLRTGIGGVWWRFWTANFLHGSVEHLTGNLLIWIPVAMMLERVVGHLRMVALVVVGSAACSVGALLVEPDIVGIGFSGVVFAAFGMSAMVDPLARRAVGRFGWLLAMLGLGLSTFVPGISSGGHVGGIMGGALLGGIVMTVWKFRRPTIRIEPSQLLTPIVDRSAPLAPNRVLGVEERLQHLRGRRDAGSLSHADFDRLHAALLARG